MKFHGKNHLNSNMYKKLRIKENKSEIEVVAIPDERFKKVELVKTVTPYITDTITELTEKEKLREIVEYFLRNNIICEIIQKDDKIVVTSTSDRQLILSLSRKHTAILNMIIEKYKNDRLKFIEECNVEKVHIRNTYIDQHFNIISNTSSYQVAYTNNDKNEEVLLITLMSKGDKLAKFDEEFIDEFMKDFISKSEQIHAIADYYNMKYGWFSNYKMIELPSNLFKKYHTDTLNHNYHFNKENKKQLCFILEKENK